MARTITDLEREIAELSAAERARLLRRLIADLDAPAETDVETAWIQESRRRLAEIDAGTVDTIPGQQVLDEARARLK